MLAYDLKGKTRLLCDLQIEPLAVSPQAVEYFPSLPVATLLVVAGASFRVTQSEAARYGHFVLWVRLSAIGATHPVARIKQGLESIAHGRRSTGGAHWDHPGAGPVVPKACPNTMHAELPPAAPPGCRSCVLASSASRCPWRPRGGSDDSSKHRMGVQVRRSNDGACCHVLIPKERDGTSPPRWKTIKRFGDEKHPRDRGLPVPQRHCLQTAPRTMGTSDGNSKGNVSHKSGSDAAKSPATA